LPEIPFVPRTDNGPLGVKNEYPPNLPYNFNIAAPSKAP